MPDSAVDGMDRVTAAHRHLSGRQNVISEGLRQAVVDTGAGPGPRLSKVGPDRSALVIAGVVAGSPHPLRLFGSGELVELRSGAAERDFA